MGKSPDLLPVTDPGYNNMNILINLIVNPPLFLLKMFPIPPTRNLWKVINLGTI